MSLRSSSIMSISSKNILSFNDLPQSQSTMASIDNQPKGVIRQRNIFKQGPRNSLDSLDSLLISNRVPTLGYCPQGSKKFISNPKQQMNGTGINFQVNRRAQLSSSLLLASNPIVHKQQRQKSVEVKQCYKLVTFSDYLKDRLGDGWFQT